MIDPRSAAPAVGVPLSPTPPRPARAAQLSRPSIPRAYLFAALCAVCLLIGGGYTALTVLRRGRLPGQGPAVAGRAAQSIETLTSQSVLVFRSLSRERPEGTVAMLPLNALDQARVLTERHCERVHFSAGWGVCLAIEQTPLYTAYRGITLDPYLEVDHTFSLPGIPSRVRVAPNGRLAAITVFVDGDSYNAVGFSTRTMLVDATNGATLADLEDFAVWRDGTRFRAADFNFWGVTFARDSNRFYATLASGGKTYLVVGDVAAREARVLRENVECPSLSPDNTRLVFKKRVSNSSGGDSWRLHLLDLATLAETPLAETRSVDDQVEWLDDARILYGFVESVGLPEDASNIWVLPVDGSAPPRILIPHASSPATVHRGQP